MKIVSKSEEYVIASRRIAGTRAERLAQIDAAIQELLDVRLLESAGDRPNVQFVAAPRQSPWSGMTLAIVAMLVLLALLFGVRAARAQTLTNGGAPQKHRFDNSQGSDGGVLSGPDNLLGPQQRLLIAAPIMAFDHPFQVSK